MSVILMTAKGKFGIYIFTAKEYENLRMYINLLKVDFAYGLICRQWNPCPRTQLPCTNFHSNRLSTVKVIHLVTSYWETNSIKISSCTNTCVIISKKSVKTNRWCAVLRKRTLIFFHLCIERILGWDLINLIVLAVFLIFRIICIYRPLDKFTFNNGVKYNHNIFIH